MKKILFLGAGSKNDPSFENVPRIKYMERHGITITKPMVIESCHGCPDLMTRYSRQMQDLIDEGNRVVGVLEGGLYFGLPSIQATEVTFPIISCPLDFVSYQAFMVPSGNATIATVGIERKLVKDEYKDVQRGKALHVAEKILNLEEDTVDVCTEEDSTDLAKRLKQFGIGISGKSKLVLTSSTKPLDVEGDYVQIWSNPILSASGVDIIKDSEEMLSKAYSTLQVRSEQDLAIYAAKILSLRRPDIKEKITGMRLEKRKSYEERNLTQELGFGV
jgi:phosphoribosylcarboxyaminoimidazole (NCAIR) mutase